MYSNGDGGQSTATMIENPEQASTPAILGGPRLPKQHV